MDKVAKFGTKVDRFLKRPSKNLSVQGGANKLLIFYVIKFNLSGIISLGGKR
jgi:hypothetical protein